MAAKSNDFESGTNGAAITAANSASPDAFGTPVGTNIATQATFSNANPHAGSLNMNFATGATYAQGYLPWSGLGIAAGDFDKCSSHGWVSLNPGTK